MCVFEFIFGQASVFLLAAGYCHNALHSSKQESPRTLRSETWIHYVVKS